MTPDVRGIFQYIEHDLELGVFDPLVLARALFLMLEYTVPA